jgi:putative ABC transport system substrate-binding protein
MARLGTAVVALLLVGYAVASIAQPATKLHRIGYLSLTAAPETPQSVLVQELRELGYIEGRNLVLEQRYAAADLKRLERFAAELASLKVDLIIASATPAVQAAQRASRTIPIVFVAVVDPVGARLVASLARPGGNTTGISLLSAELSAKRLELLGEVLPRLSRVAVLLNPSNTSNALQLRELQSAARPRGVQLEFLEVTLPGEIEPALKKAARDGANALMVFDDPMLGAPNQRARLVASVQSHRLPAVAGFAAFADAGLLLTYGPSFLHQFRRAAAYADRILKGAIPADLPVEQPAEFELIVNMKTARSLGLAVPNSVLLRANRIID